MKTSPTDILSLADVPPWRLTHLQYPPPFQTSGKAVRSTSHTAPPEPIPAAAIQPAQSPGNPIDRDTIFPTFLISSHPRATLYPPYNYSIRFMIIRCIFQTPAFNLMNPLLKSRRLFSFLAESPSIAFVTNLYLLDGQRKPRNNSAVRYMTSGVFSRRTGGITYG